MPCVRSACAEVSLLPAELSPSVLCKTFDKAIPAKQQAANCLLIMHVTLCHTLIYGGAHWQTHTCG